MASFDRQADGARLGQRDAARVARRARPSSRRRQDAKRLHCAWRSAGRGSCPVVGRRRLAVSHARARAAPRAGGDDGALVSTVFVSLLARARPHDIARHRSTHEAPRAREATRRWRTGAAHSSRPRRPTNPGTLRPRCIPGCANSQRSRPCHGRRPRLRNARSFAAARPRSPG